MRNAMRLAKSELHNLKRIRTELEESAGTKFPADVLTELLVLYDACIAIEMTDREVQEVLGPKAHLYITRYLDSMIGAEMKLAA